MPRSAATLTVLPVVGGGGGSSLTVAAAEHGWGGRDVGGGRSRTGAVGVSVFESAWPLPFALVAVTRQTMLRPPSAVVSVYVGPVAIGVPSRSQPYANVGVLRPRARAGR